MAEDAGTAQARILLEALFEQVADISQKLEAAEIRGLRTSIRGALSDRREHSELRRDLYEAHRLIESLRKRFPDTRPRRPAGGYARGALATSRIG